MHEAGPYPPQTRTLPLNFARKATMDHDQALTILKDLADGKDPETGDPFPPDSPYQRPDVIRALFHAAREMESTVASEARRGDPGKGSLPENAAGAPLASAVASTRSGKLRVAILKRRGGAVPAPLLLDVPRPGDTVAPPAATLEWE